MASARLATLSDSSKSKIRVKTIFIEVTLTKPDLVDNILEQKLDRDVREGRLRRGVDRDTAATEWKDRVNDYRKLYARCRRTAARTTCRTSSS